MTKYICMQKTLSNQNLLNIFQPISDEVGYDIIEASNDQIIPVAELTDCNS